MRKYLNPTSLPLPPSIMENSPLGRLSGELRNMIYSYLWPDHTEAVICLCGRHHPLRSHLRNPKAGDLWTYTGSHLPRVCRQLRHEALGHFFSSSDFVLPLRYILQADEQFKLEDEWERFVRLFGVKMVRQIRRLTVHAGNINNIIVDRPRNWPGKLPTERESIDRGFAILSNVDIPCGFARRCVRPCLHPGARMMVVLEHQNLRGGEGKCTCIDFDDREATAARIQKSVIADFRDSEPWRTWSWEYLWPDLLAKWYGDETLGSSVAEDTLWDFMHLDCGNEAVCDDQLDREALAGLLNIARPQDLGHRCEMDEDPEISTDSFMLAYAPFSGKQMAFAGDWRDEWFDVAVDIEGSSDRFERLARRVRDPKRTPGQLKDMVEIITLPEMCRIFKETSPLLWEWERVFRLKFPDVRKIALVPP